MKKGIFYTETIVKLKEDITGSEVYGISDNLDEIKIKFLNETGKPASKEEILKYLELKSIDNISENSIQKEIKKLKKDKDKMKEFTAELAKEITDPLELVTKLDEYILNSVKTMLQERSYFKKNKIIRIPGITKEEEGQLVLYSKSILWKDKMKKPSKQGIKVFSNSGYQLPVILKKIFQKQGNKYIPSNNDFKVVLSPLANTEHVKFLFEHLFRTLNAKKENKINAIPTIFISIKKENKLEQETINLINEINEFQKELIETNNFSNIENLFNKFYTLLNTINNNPDTLADIEIKLPLPIQNPNPEQMKIKLKTHLLDVGVKVKEKEVGKEKLKEIVEKTINELFNDYIEINTTYRIDDYGYGFFENNLDIYNETPKSVISSTAYDKAVDKILNETEKIKKSSTI